MSDPYVIVIDPNPTYETSEPIGPGGTWSMNHTDTLDGYRRILVYGSDEQADWNWPVEDDPVEIAKVVSYLRQLEQAQVIDSFELVPLRVFRAADMLEQLTEVMQDDLDEWIEGQEEYTNYDSDGGSYGDSNPEYRAAMKDAGRGHLLR